MTVLWGIHNDTNLDLVGGGFISIGWDALGDLRLLGADRESLKERLAAAYPEVKPGAIRIWAGLMLRFAHEMQAGDIVVAPQKSDSTVNLGRVSGDYYFDVNASVHNSRRPVTWLKTGIPRAQFSQEARYEIGSAVTLFRVKKHTAEFLAALDGGPAAIDAPASEEVLSVDDATASAENLPNADRIDQYTRDFVIDRLYTKLHGYEFEQFVAHLLTCMGYRTQVTQASGDGGIDVIAHKDPLALEPPIIKVQCKKVVTSMGGPDVQRLIGTLAPGNAEFGLFVTLGSFSKEAQALGRTRQDLRLISGTELVSLIFEHYERFDTRWKSLLPMRRVYVVDRDPTDIV
jgi:restriction system protein